MLHPEAAVGMGQLLQQRATSTLLAKHLGDSGIEELSLLLRAGSEVKSSFIGLLEEKCTNDDTTWTALKGSVWLGWLWLWLDIL